MLKMNLQVFAHKKGVGSTKNGRDSESKRQIADYYAFIIPDIMQPPAAPHSFRLIH